jgi:hypothetical protein
MRLSELTENKNMLYHGTYKIKAARDIVRKGLRGAEIQGKSHLAPMKGRVYMTPSLRYAIIYAIGGVYLGSKYPKDHIESGQTYGYVFEIDPDDLTDDMLPDEDIVGEALAEAYQIDNNPKYVPYSDIGKELVKNPNLVKSLSYNFKICRRDIPSTCRSALDGMITGHARLGKHFLRKHDANYGPIKAIMNLKSAHQSHGGSVMPIRAWRIDRRLTQKLEKDGSNFFDIAKLVWTRSVTESVGPNKASGHDESYIRLTENIIAYHGSSSDNPTFAASHTGNNSHTFGAYTSNRTGVFFSDNSEFAAMYGDIKKYSLAIENPCTDCGEWAFRFSMTLDAHSPDERPLWIDLTGIVRSGDNQLWALFEDDVGKAFVPWLIQQGFDSAQFNEWNEDDDGNDHESNTTVVFDPNNINQI